jgi:hypothetical protein
MRWKLRAVLRIRIGFKEDPDPALKFYADPGLLEFFDPKSAIYSINLYDIQATEEAFSPQERSSSTSKHGKFLHFFLFLWAILALMDPDPADQNQGGSNKQKK